MGETGANEVGSGYSKAGTWVGASPAPPAEGEPGAAAFTRSAGRRPSGEARGGSPCRGGAGTDG